ncbi:efflux RND transporter periplasmic adaptor subunit [Rivihabitans pingtungensis]|uniref:efflux RND transporter periplasmic adaptor subunit n=1 Tax=Rivihabitans pingtungensis TaxID=1054498 RepID=UPI0023540A7C|nr:efflux RND transporter periplasmic adaptor subunit [Rivihabitans pingtungensis]MCK6437679.1 efflux RND transporter periplasmic adaptor subunit [Rivihabitans pingtungensis]
MKFPGKWSAWGWRGWGVVVMLLAAAGWWGWRQWSAAGQPGYVTQTVTVGTLEKVVTALGSVQPKDYVDVGTQVSGQLRELHVQIGDTVQKGQLLAEVDPTVYATRVAADKASLRDLQAQRARQASVLQLAEVQKKRTRELLALSAASQDAVDMADAAAAQARATLESLAAQIDKAESTLAGDEANLGYTKIYAPMDGVVVSQPVFKGQTVNSAQQAPTLMRVANLDVMTVNAQVAEADVPQLKPGMPVYFTTLGHAERRYQSRIRQILPTPEKVNDVVLFTVLIDIDNRARELMTSMTTQTFFVLGRAENLPIVPLSALRPLGEGGKLYGARVLTENGIERRKVKVALTSRTEAAVASGLAAGETLIVSDGRPRAGKAGGGKSNNPSAGARPPGPPGGPM